jgi:hypothetical protein
MTTKDKDTFDWAFNSNPNLSADGDVDLRDDDPKSCFEPGVNKKETRTLSLINLYSVYTVATECDGFKNVRFNWYRDDERSPCNYVHLIETTRTKFSTSRTASVSFSLR